MCKLWIRVEIEYERSRTALGDRITQREPASLKVAALAAGAMQFSAAAGKTGAHAGEHRLALRDHNNLTPFQQIGWTLVRAGSQGDLKMEAAANARLGVNLQHAAHQVYKLPTDTQPESAAAKPTRRCHVRLHKGFEDSLECIL